MKTIEVKFTNYQARVYESYLQTRYKSKAKLSTLVKLATMKEVTAQAQQESDEATAKI